jgi:serpin B
MLTTMTKVETSSYAEGNGWQCLEMPFKSNAVSFSILLPKDAAQRKKIESEFSDETWTKVEQAMTAHEVTSFIPRFSYSTQLSLKTMWQTLGAKDVFIDGKADLSNMIEKEPCFITDVIQQATIEVNEVGAEAAAATAAPADPFGSAMPAPLKRVIFRADKPFLWLITHRNTGLILFMGRYAGR